MRSVEEMGKMYVLVHRHGTGMITGINRPLGDQGPRFESQRKKDGGKKGMVINGQGIPGKLPWERLFREF